MTGVPIESLAPEVRRKALAALDKQPRPKPSRAEIKGEHLPLRCSVCGETIYPATETRMRRHTDAHGGARLEVVLP